MERSKVGEKYILEAARRYFGIEKMKDIKYAILKKSGSIIIVPLRAPDEKVVSAGFIIRPHALRIKKLEIGRELRSKS